MIAASLIVFLVAVHGAFSNRAFPVDAENFAIKQFQAINPNIEYDETNFLVDLSGRYVVCSRVGQRGQMKVSETYDDGTSINGLVDYGFGSLTHVNAVNQYIEETIQEWAYDPEFSGTITSATKFGCSVRPGCAGNYVVGCVFDGLRGLIVSTTPKQQDEGEQNALAFTGPQYDLAEIITGSRWDRNHYLENLSGYATECGMVGRDSWNFDKEKARAAADMGYRIEGMVGSARNMGQTEPAMEEILMSMQGVMYKVRPSQIGCSLIPDCVIGGQMYVVIGCLYQE